MIFQSSIIYELFKPIYGKPCWHVRQGYGSFLTLEFGQPFLQIHEPRQASEKATEKVRKNAARRHVYVYGDWHLWTYLCDWRITFQGQELASHDANRKTIKNATTELDGQLLTQVKVTDSLATIFEFDLGGRLEVFPNHDNYKKTADLWLLYEKPGNVFILRADGQYCYMPGDTPSDKHIWQPLIANSVTDEG